MPAAPGAPARVPGYTHGMAEGKWYWCFEHDRAERASDCRADRRLGPYPSQAAAEGWRDRVEARNDRWETEDRRWRGDPEG